MAEAPPDGGGGSDMFSVTPQTLQAAAPMYYQQAQEIDNLKQTLSGVMQLTLGDMFLLIEFDQLANKLEQLQARINVAMQCASKGLENISVALEVAADEYMFTDQEVSGTFTKIEDDPNPQNFPFLKLPANMLGAKPAQTMPAQRLPQPGPAVPEPDPLLPSILKTLFPFE